MKITIKTHLLVLMCIIMCSCGSAPRSHTPPAPAEVTQIATITPEVLQLVSIRLDEIRLSEPAYDRNREIKLSSVWMIPLYASTQQGMGARFQYIEDEVASVAPQHPYHPSSPWFISVNRKDLNEATFGIWFMVVSIENDDSELWNQFTGLITDLIPVFAFGAVAAILVPVTPGIPDEAILATKTATRGRAVLGRAAALGRGLEGFLRRMITQTDMLPRSAEALASNLAESASLVDHMGYFGEAYVTFSPEANYSVNNRVSVVTTDGSLVIEFSIIETSNSQDIVNYTHQGTVESYLPVEDCNPETPTALMSGLVAEVVRPVAVSSSPFDDNVVSRNLILEPGERITPLIPYCNEQENVLWWRVSYGEQEYGWIPESSGQLVFVRLVD